MKKLFFALLSFAFISAGAQTVDEIVQKYTNAMGGLDAFNKIQTVKMTGTVTAQGNDFPITVQVINGKAFRSDVEVMGSSITNAYKDGKGWKINPFAGATTATEMTSAELSATKIQSMLANQLMDYKNRGNKVELAGQEDVDGAKAFKLTLTSKEDGKVTTYFIRTTDYMLVKSVSTQDMQGQSTDVESFYSDVKDFNGVKFSTSRTQKIEGQVFQEIKFDKIELNVPVDEKIFDMQK